MSDEHTLDVATIRARLASLKGKQFWQGLEELAETPQFGEFLHREFPREAAVWSRTMDRRSFLKLLGASLALAGLAGCVNVPAQKIVPYVKAPDPSVIPGKSLYYTTAITLSGFASGLLVESTLGRPIKAEGNPDHPASLGATDTYAQAALLGLYDPDRSQTVLNDGQIRTYNDLVAEFAAAISAARPNDGEGIRILTETTSSPTLAAQIKSITNQFPRARWHQWEPAGHDNAFMGAQLAFGTDANTVYHFDTATTVLALDSDFLASHPDTLRFAHDFIQRRKVRGTTARMNRLYAVEGSPTLTGAKSDHRLRVQAGQIEAVALNAAARLGVAVRAPALPNGVAGGWIDALVRDLQANRGSSIVIAGDAQPPLVHALAHAMNAALGNVGKTVTYTAPVVANPTDLNASLSELVQDMNAGRVNLLVILSANPAYSAPNDIPFAQALPKVQLSIHLGLYQDETATLAHWHIPEAHFLEAWSDTRAFDGTAAIVQPLIEPLYPAAKSAHEVLALFTNNPQQKSYDLVRAYWQGQHKGSDFETWWQGALNKGVVPDSALPATTPAMNMGQITQAAARATPPVANGLEIIFLPDPSIHDGRFANISWLQELPKPLTKLTWDNAVLLSPATAERLGVQTQDLVELSYRGRSVRAPVFVMPGHADNSATVHLGYGRSSAGQVGSGLGFNAYLLRTSQQPWFDQGLELVKAGGTYTLATTQFHWQMQGRDIVRTGTADEYNKDPNFLGNQPPEISLYPKWPYPNAAWGMAIDLTACTGCNACVIACQAENNIPTVGKEGVAREREMHWLRVDRYYEGTNLDDPQTVFQPVPCMQCENAPCEQVCPVGATVHSDEGLNDMVYNRCVGTRYCSNNCPYKVRRFNFFSYTDTLAAEPTLKMLQNPEVTVRNRGVMEKCTYCVQRIRSAESEAEKDNRPVRDGEIVTACQAACPANAITFGNINDPNAQLTQWKSLPLNYTLLAELNTHPRTTYLAELRNPNPEIEALGSRAEAAPGPLAGSPIGTE
jgi:molybdopterin-containing oxidoreductase family iron-sulfur binding subunit